MISEQKQNELMIIEDLYRQFQIDLKQQSFELITKHTAEQMHILSMEKNRAQLNAERIEKGFFTFLFVL